MRWVRPLARFFGDWRNAATALASVVIAMLIVLTVEGIRSRNQAAEALQSQANQATQLRAAASKRIDKLNAELVATQDRVARGEEDRGRLAAEVRALAEQIRQMGGRPVVTTVTRPVPEAASSPAPARASSVPRTTTGPSPRPSRSPVPSPRPSPTRSCLVPLLGVGCA